MSKLIAKLEAATEGSRELDRLIAQSLGYIVDHQIYGFDQMLDWEIFGDDNLSRGRLPFYTTSIDAALTLVPEGFMWEAGSYTDVDGFQAGHFAHVDTYCGGDGPRFEMSEEGATPALAICIAALKARSST